MIELFAINVIIVLGDTALVTLEYIGNTLMERTWKGLVMNVWSKISHCKCVRWKETSVRFTATNFCKACFRLAAYDTATRTGCHKNGDRTRIGPSVWYYTGSVKRSFSCNDSFQISQYRFRGFPWATNGLHTEGDDSLRL